MVPYLLNSTRKYSKKISRLLYPSFIKSQRKIRGFHNRYRNQRCFILGNGPSLGVTDLNLLKEEITFGLNRIYLLFDQYDFLPTFYVAVNHLIIQQSADEIIARVPCPKFIDWDARRFLKNTKDIIFLESHHQEPRFFTDITQGVWQGMTVTYVAMQIAYYLGFPQVILIGVDHDFKTTGKAHQVVTSDGDDPDHFDKNYFGKGYRWQLPDLEGSEVAYQMAKYQFTRAGREILDATVGGKLTVFPKVDYSSLFVD